ncbi:hypothetical protein ACFQE1_21375 [Halobium palmae]|uniref:Uncharacterized protein n=1 Tax=Halobium palmae TaxID=1776492 RepID=A0ABD5S5B0_9EURY
MTIDIGVLGYRFAPTFFRLGAALRATRSAQKSGPKRSRARGPRPLDRDGSDGSDEVGTR